MRGDIAIVRQHIEKIEGVSRTWFEWTVEDDTLLKTLVVEVDFDTDPNSPQCRANVLHAIKDTCASVLQNETTMMVSYLRIVPKQADEGGDDGR
jgi:hypothetical protein